MLVALLFICLWREVPFTLALNTLKKGNNSEEILEYTEGCIFGGRIDLDGCHYFRWKNRGNRHPVFCIGCGKRDHAPMFLRTSGTGSKRSEQD